MTVNISAYVLIYGVGYDLTQNKNTSKGDRSTGRNYFRRSPT
ncbi:hypothetical protein [Calothrix sp. 336/3]|nr:hypothetical protein [Calothrix sp. 336/3]